MGEQVEAPPPTRQRTGPGATVAMVSVSVSEVTDSRLVIYPHPLFGEMVSFKKDALFPSKGSAIFLNSPLYALKLAHSMIPVPDR